MKKIITGIKQNIKLSNFNTFRTGGKARFFYEAKSEDSLVKVLKFAKENKLKFFIIGNGSNLLINDEDFPGLVIRMLIKGKKVESKREKNSVVSAFAGESFDNLILFVIKHNLSGIENLWNIPGTVGAAVVQNLGAYGVEVDDFVESVEGVDINNFKKFVFNRKDCDFAYRDNIFKRNKKLIITKVFFKLNNNFSPNLKYESLKRYFLDKKTPDIKEVIKAITEIRKAGLPDWRVIGSAGSFFKNPVITKEKCNELFADYPNMPKYEAKPGYVKIPIGFVLDKILGLKGYREGKVGTFEKQSLIIVNHGGATYSEIDSFAKKIEKIVFNKFKIKIEREVVEI